MIIYNELEAIIRSHCRGGVNVLEIGGEPEGYLTTINDISLIRTNVKSIKGLNCVADGQNLPFKSNYFDLIFMIAVDYYIPDVELCFSEVYRVLKPNGYFINATYNKVNLERQITLDSFALRAFSTKDHLSMYKQIGFETTLKKIANNPPKSFIKRLVWRFIPRFMKVRLSSWQIFINKKIY